MSSANDFVADYDSIFLDPLLLKTPHHGRFLCDDGNAYDKRNATKDGSLPRG